MTPLSALIVILFAVMGIAWWWRHRSLACPANLAWLVDNAGMNAIAGPEKLFSRMQLEQGMKLLDVGCGPGRLTLPAAHWVGESGEVVALDMQKRMLNKLQAKLETHGVHNVRMIHAGAGEGKVPHNYFDRALLVTVLGEIGDKPRALQEVYDALKPGGILSVTEMLPDPHYTSRKRVSRLCRKAGFQEDASFGGRFVFTLNFTKPAAPY